MWFASDSPDWVNGEDGNIWTSDRYPEQVRPLVTAYNTKQGPFWNDKSLTIRVVMPHLRDPRCLSR